MTDPSGQDGNVHIEPGLRPEHHAIAAAGYWNAFSRKLRYPLGPDVKALAFIASVLKPDHAISAVTMSGSFLGLASFKTPEGSFVGGGLRDLAKIYGWFGGTARGFLAAILDQQAKPDTLMVDGIFVQPEARSQGVGSALLDAIERKAAGLGLTSISLDVVDANPRAKALYERRGFVESARVSLGILKPLFGFRAVTTMVKTIA